jgi:hypothetical protein
MMVGVWNYGVLLLGSHVGEHLSVERFAVVELTLGLATSPPPRVENTELLTLSTHQRHSKIQQQPRQMRHFSCHFTYGVFVLFVCGYSDIDHKPKGCFYIRV